MPSPTPKVVATTLLDVHYPVSGGVGAGYVGGARIYQLAQPLLKVPVATTAFDVTYQATGGVVGGGRARVYTSPAEPFPFPTSNLPLDVTYRPSGGVGIEGEAHVFQQTGPLVPLPFATELLRVSLKGKGGAWANGGALWQAANYPIGAVIGGGIASGRGLVEYIYAPRSYGLEPITIIFGDGATGSGGYSGAARGAMGLTIGVGGNGVPIDDGSSLTTGGRLPPIDLSGFHTSDDLLEGSGGTITSGKITYLGGEINYVGTPRGTTVGQGPPFHITLNISGEIVSLGGGGTMGLYDPAYPGLGGWDNTAGGLNISLSGLGGYGGDYDLSSIVTVNDRTTGIPGGFYNPAPAPGAGSAVFGDQGLHATLPILWSDITGYLAINGIAASLPHLTSSIDAIVGVRGNIDARLTRLGSTVNVFTNITGPINAKLPLITGSLDDADVSYPRITARLPRIEGSITVAVSGVITAPLRPINGVLVPGIAAVVNAQLPAPTAALRDDTISAQMPLLQGTLVVAADIKANLTLIKSHFGFQPSYGVTQQVMVTNTQTTAISNYTDYPFNSYCEVNGVYFAASDTGLHQIDTGTDDSGQPIRAGIRTGMMIFADPMQKRTFDAFTTMRSSGGLTLTIHVEEAARHAPVSISMIPRASAGLVKYRGILPKGLRGKTWQFELNNVDGSAFDFNDLSFLEVPATRRI